MSRIYHTTQGRYGKLGLASKKDVKDVDNIYHEVPGFLLELTLAWQAGLGEETEILNPESGLFEVTRPPTPAGPECFDIDRLTPSTRISLEAFEGRFIGTPRINCAGLDYEQKLDKLEEWVKSDYAKNRFGFMLGDPRGERKVKVTMTVQQYEEMRKDKGKGSEKLPVLPSPSTSPVAHPVTRGARTVSSAAK